MQKIAWDITWDNLGAEHLQTQHAFELDMIRSMSLALERACEEMGLRPGKKWMAERIKARKTITLQTSHTSVATHPDDIPRWRNRSEFINGWEE
jgi:hypothetical protein